MSCFIFNIGSSTRVLPESVVPSYLHIKPYYHYGITISSISYEVCLISISVPARHISEGAAPCPYCLAPCPIYTAPCPNTFLFLFFTPNCCFCVFRQLMNCKMFADLCSCFHRSPTKLCPDLVSFTVLDCGQILVVHALNCA